MPLASGKLVILSLDQVGYKAKFDEQMKEVYKDALRAFLDAVVAHVPIETGMAVGALLPLADFLGEQIAIFPTVARKGRSPEEGAKHSLFEVVEWRFPKYHVKLNVEVVNGWLWDNNASLFNARIGRSVTAGPWRSIEYGRDAFREYLRAHVKFAFPEVNKFMVRTEKPYGR